MAHPTRTRGLGVGAEGGGRPDRDPDLPVRETDSGRQRETLRERNRRQTERQRDSGGTETAQRETDTEMVRETERRGDSRRNKETRRSRKNSRAPNLAHGPLPGPHSDGGLSCIQVGKLRPRTANLQPPRP